MIILKTKNYKKNVNTLSSKEISLLYKQEKFLEANIFYPNLHTKKLKGFPIEHVYSFRITRSHRGIFRLDGHKIILFAIGHRKDIYQSL